MLKKITVTLAASREAGTHFRATFIKHHRDDPWAPAHLREACLSKSIFQGFSVLLLLLPLYKMSINFMSAYRQAFSFMVGFRSGILPAHCSGFNLSESWPNRLIRIVHMATVSHQIIALQFFCNFFWRNKILNYTFGPLFLGWWILFMLCFFLKLNHMSLLQHTTLFTVKFQMTCWWRYGYV